ncbi:MAG: hypothetical protein QOF00_5626 [Pseudonocardiales bacterium]|nr:hypothetical protein [Pseudonocardiales bacterium]
MIPYEIDGLPAHVMFIHAVVVLVPLTALLVVGTAVWPAARRRLGVAVPILALVMLGAVQLTISAGEWLIRRVPVTPLVRAHAHLADGMLPWAIVLAVVAIAVWAQRFLPSDRVVSSRRAEDDHPDRPGRAEGAARVDSGPSRTGPGTVDTETLTRVSTASTGRRSTLAIVIAGVAVVAALAAGVGATVQCYRVGEAGSRAVWTDNFSADPLPPTPPH